MDLAERRTAERPPPHASWLAHVVAPTGVRTGAANRWPVAVDGSLFSRHGVRWAAGAGGRLVTMQIVAGSREEALDSALRRWFYLADDLDLQTLAVQIEVEELT